jgi:hypothetical protein
MASIAVQFKLKDNYGGGVIIGEKFDTIETIAAILNEKYGDKIDTVVVLNEISESIVN